MLAELFIPSDVVPVGVFSLLLKNAFHQSMRSAPSQLLVTFVVLSQVALQQCCGAADIPVVVSSVRNLGSNVNLNDIAVDRENNLLYVYGSCVYRLTLNGRVQQIAGSTSSSGTTDGVGEAARFGAAIWGITYDTVNNIAYVSDTVNSRIRTLDLSNNSVLTLAGNTSGYQDGVGMSALFSGNIYGVVHYPSQVDGMVLFVGDYGNSRVRRITVVSASVTTIAQTLSPCYFLCISRDGSSLYVGTDNTIVRIDPSTGAMVTLAGGTTGFADGIGASARFSSVLGIALNDNETALFVAEYSTNVVRRIDLLTNNVSTEAGAYGIPGLTDGPGLAARFSYLYGAKWYCNATSLLCGLLVADPGNGAIRLVAVERMPTRTLSAPLSFSHSVNSPTRSCSEATSSTPSVTHSNALTESGGTSSRTSSSSKATRTASSSRTASQTSFSSSKATRTASDTRRSSSPSATMYCALIAAVGTSSVGNLQRFHSSEVLLVPIVATQTVSSTSTFVSAAPISRAVLLQNLPLGMNLSVSLGGTIRGGPEMDDWTLVSAIINVLAASSEFPLVTAVMPFTILFADVVGSQQSLAVALQPPNTTNRWVPSSLSTFLEVSLVVTLVLRCPTDPTVTGDVVVEIPCPGEVQALAAEVKAASSVALYSMSLTGPAGGSAVGRFAAVRSLVLCSSSTDKSSVGLLAPLSIYACDDTNVASAAARGAIVGNIACWAGACVLMALVVASYARLARVSPRNSMEALGAPSQLLPLAIVTVPSTASSTFYVLREAQCSLDGMIAVVGVVMCACPVVILCWVAYMAPRRLVRVKHVQQASSNGELKKWMPVALHNPIAILFHRRVRWVEANTERRGVVDACSVKSDPGTKARGTKLDDPKGRRTPSWSRMATIILIDYALVWYVFVDVAVLTAAGFLGAVGSLGSGSACRATATVLLLLYLGQLVLCAVVRPFATLFSHVYALFTLTLSTLAVAFQVWYLFGSVVDSVDLSTLSQLLTAAAACDIVVAAVSILKSLLDVFDVLRACRRHVNAMFPKLQLTASSFSEPEHPKPVVEDSLLEVPHEFNETEDNVYIGTLMESLNSPLNAAHDDGPGDDGTILTAKESAYQVHHDLLHFYLKTQE
ncbi:membrane-associated protein, putative [Bodo saltans]|uniref:Membrane-associated protein, putative n=1 Tax=Bodo saltans TaxID=75058 RepID=A0A0S4JH16_BODSA|nr:membrane-associated protein, putative [Bodo saltans]|eukprot:CUG88521.1 membrane-associated protein, putative [Bodo saltans]